MKIHPSKRHSIKQIARIAYATLGVGTQTAALAKAGPLNQPLEIVTPFQMTSGVTRNLLDRFGNLLPNGYYLSPKPGANGLIAMKYVANATENDLRVLLSTVSTSILHFLLDKDINLTLQQNFNVVGKFYQAPLILVGLTSKFVDFHDFIKKHKQSPLHYNFGSAGIAGFYHFNYLLLKEFLGIESTHIPYSKDLYMGLFRGEIDYTFMSPFEAMELTKSGHIRMLASTSNRRIPILPNVPTLYEFNKNLSSYTKFNLLAAKTMHHSKIEYLNSKLALTLVQPETKDLLKKDGATTFKPLNTEQAGLEILKDTLTWKKIIKKQLGEIEA